MPDAKILHRGTAGHSYPELTSLESRGEGGSKIKVLSPVDRRVAFSAHSVNMWEGETEQLDLSCSALALGHQCKSKKNMTLGSSFTP